MKADQGNHANDVHFAQLIGHYQKAETTHPYSPMSMDRNANRIKGKQWDDTMFQMEIDVNDETCK